MRCLTTLSFYLKVQDGVDFLLFNLLVLRCLTAQSFYLKVQDGVDFLLFNLLVLRCLTDKTGHVWRRSELDLYLIENMPLMKTAAKMVSLADWFKTLTTH